MNVQLLNPEQVNDLFKNWSVTSAICYDSKINPEKPEAIGKHCKDSGHFSGSRGDFIKFIVTDCDRSIIDQCVRHEIGVFKNVASFRYISKDRFAYSIPTEIKDNKLLVDKYINHMEKTMDLYTEIQMYVKDKTGNQERANEQARYVLPMSTHTAFVIGFTIEAFIHFCNLRLCVRAEDGIREMAHLMKDVVLKVRPDLANDLVPQCVKLMYCPEGRSSCGAYPTKKQIKELIERHRDELKDDAK